MNLRIYTDSDRSQLLEVDTGTASSMVKQANNTITATLSATGNKQVIVEQLASLFQIEPQKAKFNATEVTPAT